jgi:protein phosphatase
MRNLNYFCISDTGCVRGHNEDNYGVDEKLGVYIVADGMGGHEAGEVASKIAVDTVISSMRKGSSLKDSIIEAHNEILNSAKINPESEGMGTTIVVVKLNGLNYEIAWVGDSRVYLWDGGGLIQLTKDHSYVQKLIDKGFLSQQDARNHPQRNVITQSLGVSNAPITVDIISGKFTGEEKLLMCSDGLNTEVEDSDIALILSKSFSIEQAAKDLVDLAKEKGGSDNITVMIIESPDVNHSSKTSTREAFVTKKNKAIIEEKKSYKKIFIIIFLLILLLLGIFMYFYKPINKTKHKTVSNIQSDKFKHTQIQSKRLNAKYKVLSLNKNKQVTSMKII